MLSVQVSDVPCLRFEKLSHTSVCTVCITCAILGFKVSFLPIAVFEAQATVPYTPRLPHWQSLWLYQTRPVSIEFKTKLSQPELISNVNEAHHN